MQDRESFLPEEFRAALRAPVDLGAGARARVMQRVRAAATLARIVPAPRGIARPSVVGALLAASFVATLLTGGVRSASDDGAQATLADTIAMHFEAAAEAATRPPAIDRERLVAVADETRIPAPAPDATQRARRD
ncbi:MAG: hypothetical protein ACREN6_07730 [Gemmatimonadaceae bacterium]